MSIIQNSKIDSFEGGEGVKIKEYFNPNNTSNQINYSIAKCSLDVGKKTKLHKIKSSEIYYILQGKGNLKINEKIFYLEKNDSAHVPPNSKQFIENIGSENLSFICIVEPAWKAEDDEILEE